GRGGPPDVVVISRPRRPRTEGVGVRTADGRLVLALGQRGQTDHGPRERRGARDTGLLPAGGLFGGGRRGGRRGAGHGAPPAVRTERAGGAPATAGSRPAGISTPRATAVAGT